MPWQAEFCNKLTDDGHFICRTFCFIISIKTYQIQLMKNKETLRKIIITRTKLYIVALMFFAANIFAVYFLISPERAIAAIPSDAQLTQQGRNSPECKRAAANDTVYNNEEAVLKVCAKEYVHGYKNPKTTNGDKTDFDYCKKAGYAIAIISVCVAGHKKGRADRVQADKDAQQPKPSGNLTDAQIKKLATTSPECMKLKSSSNDPSLNANYGHCTLGYFEGYKGTKTKQQACSNSAVKANCEAGYDAGKADKAAGVKTASEQSEASAKRNDPTNAGPEGGSITDCDAKFLNPLSWIICPIIDIGADLTDSMFQNVISPLLSDVPISDNREDPVYKAWQGFRLIANIMLVGSMLAIVYAQTRGGDK
jgi:hypothetical protein